MVYIKGRFARINIKAKVGMGWACAHGSRQQVNYIEDLGMDRQYQEHCRLTMTEAANKQIRVKEKMLARQSWKFAQRNPVGQNRKSCLAACHTPVQSKFELVLIGSNQQTSDNLDLKQYNVMIMKQRSMQ